MRNSCITITAHPSKTDNAAMRETHRETGQDVPEDVQLSPNVNQLHSRKKKQKKKKDPRNPYVQNWAGNDTHSRQQRWAENDAHQQEGARSRETRATFEIWATFGERVVTLDKAAGRYCANSIKFQKTTFELCRRV